MALGLMKEVIMMDCGAAGKPTHGGDIQRAAMRYGLNPGEIIDFSASINPLGPAESARSAIIENLSWLRHYPEAEAASLRRALADTHGVEEKCIVPGNGCMELMYLSARIFSPGRILCLAPSYGEYGQGGLRPLPRNIVPLKTGLDFSLDLDRLDETLETGDLLYAGHPNNPTGRLLSEWELGKLAEWVEERKAFLVIDQAFLDFAGPGAPSAFKMAVQSSRVLVLGSMTKFYSLPGLRLGYAVAKPELARKMEMLLPPWRVNCLAIAAGIASLRDADFINNTLEWLQRSRQEFREALQALGGLKVYPSDANFLLVNSQASGVTSRALQDRIGPQGFLIRDCSDFKGLDGYYFRVAVRRSEDNLGLVKALEHAIDGGSIR